MTPNALVKKLLIKPGQRALLLNAPAEYRAQLEPLPDRVELTETPDGECDFIQLFVRNRQELDDWLPRAVAAGGPHTLLWISYLKGGAKAGTDLNRDRLWEALLPHGLTGVTLVAIDGTWSAMRFRPSERVDSARTR
ncbi:MAG TPA: hypothetical protein VKX16_09000 [Chloroflexota bacterium]|nr:hypothetical protein [Chloroflexota bacterium]